MRAERTRAGGTWTEARFFQFIRTSLRQASIRWPAKAQAKNKARRKYDGPNRRQKWEYQCAQCGDWFMGKDVELDHIVPVGTLKTFADLPGFAERLFCEEDGYQVLCKERCHARKTRPTKAV